MNKEANGRSRAPVECDVRGEWNFGGLAPADGYYWVVWRFGTEDKTKSHIKEFYSGYIFSETTKWAGPILSPNEELTRPPQVGGSALNDELGKDHPALKVVAEFSSMRDSCAFYQGIKNDDNDDQCRHLDQTSGWCAMDCCPLLQEHARQKSLGWD